LKFHKIQRLIYSLLKKQLELSLALLLLKLVTLSIMENKQLQILVNVYKKLKQASKCNKIQDINQ
jgi:hypothetical protein